MPDLMDSLWGEAVDVNGFAFNTGPRDRARYGIDIFEGWDSTPSFELVAANHALRDGGYAPGGGYLGAKEYALGGWVVADTRADFTAARDRVNAAFPKDTDLVITRQEPTAKQVTVRRSGQVVWENGIDVGQRFTVPLLAVDPLKYATSEITATVGVARPRRYVRHYPRTYPLTYLAANEQVPVVVATNHILNPSFEQSLVATWQQTSASGDASRVVVGGGITPYRGEWVLDVTTEPGERTDVATTLRVPMTGELAPGSTITASARAVQFVGEPATTVWLGFYDLAGDNITTIAGPATTASWKWLPASVTYEVPADAATAIVFITAESLNPDEEAKVLIDGVMLNAGGELDYFDGDDPSCEWRGAPHASFSNRIVYEEVQAAATAETVVNAGNADTYPYESQVRGPLPAGWTLENSTTGEFLGFTRAVAAGEVVDIDHRGRSARVGGAVISGSSFGTWWSIRPGPNTLRLQSSTYNADARWDFRARSAWE